MIRKRTIRAIAFVLLIVVGTLGSLDFASGGTRTKSFKHKGKVNTIVQWIDNKQNPTTPLGLDDWNNANLTPSKTDSTAIFRLVTNANVTLDAPTQEVLTHSTTGEPLATYYKLTTDGDGVTATGLDAAQAGDGVGSFFYVGGGSTNWEILNSLTPGTFLGTAGKTITHVNNDGACLVTVTVRGWNGEDFGADSDNTEAPDVGTASDYTATLVLRATAI